MLKVDVSSLQAGVSPGLERAKERLEMARNSAASISCPNGFSMVAEVRSIPSRISAVIGNLATAERSVKETISRFENAESLNSNIVQNLEIYSKFKNIPPVSFLKTIKGNTKVWNFGPSQDIENIEKQDSEYYNEVVKRISQRHNMSIKDAKKLLEIMNGREIQGGACSYAALATGIILKYRDNPKAFEDNYKISLYRFKKLSNGELEMKLNDLELMAELFIGKNTYKESPITPYNDILFNSILKESPDGKLTFTEDSDANYDTVGASAKVDWVQEWATKSAIENAIRGINPDRKWAGVQVTTLKNWDENNIPLTNKEIENLKNNIQSALNAQQAVVMDFDTSQGIILEYDGKEADFWENITGEHEVAIVGITPTDVIINNYGKDMKLSFERLKNYGKLTIKKIVGL